jgi:putative NADH-flavin reductase
MKLAIFGASGRTGQHLVQQALDARHEVVALIRTPSKLNIQNTRLTLIQGDIQDIVKVEQTIKGVDAVLSVLGPTSNKPDYQVTKGTKNILVAMKKLGVRKLVISAGAGVGDPHDEPKLANKFINILLKIMARYVYEDMKQVVDLVRASDVDWVIVRVPMLTDAPATGSIKIGYVGKGMGSRISRADMAAFILKQLDDNTYLHHAPAISN